jgi:ATP-dependent Clp protease ATP-binding subunit ClpC
MEMVGKVNFKNTLIIMTSNIGVKQLSQFGAGMGFETYKPYHK